MKPDLYTKAVLTVIAVMLSVIAAIQIANVGFAVNPAGRRGFYLAEQLLLD